MKCFVAIAALLSSVAAEADPALFYGGYNGILGAGYNGYALGGYAGYGAGLYGGAIAAAPVPYARAAVAAPVAAVRTVAAPVAAVRAIAAPAPVPQVAAQQTHAQDELGNYEYSYNNINSAKAESGNALTGVKGSYSFVDATGIRRTTNYVADAFGYRAVNNLNVPAYGAYTARIHKRSVGVAPIAPLGYAGLPATQVLAPTGLAGYSGYALPAAQVAAPIAAPVQQISYAAPAQAAIPSVKTTIKLNPGHAIMYRVDPAY